MNKVQVLLDESNESYYWIGFLFADGWVSETVGSKYINLSIADIEHAYRFADYVDGNVVLIPKDNHKTQGRVSVGSKKYVPQIIEKYGLYRAKTTKGGFLPPNMNSEQFFSFVAGFIDGDGMFARQGGNKSGRPDFELRIKLHSSWLPFLIELETRLYKELNIVREPKAKLNGQGYAQLRIQKFAIVQELREKVFETELITLSRKWSF